MTESYPDPPRQRRAFLLTPYVEEGGDRMVPCMPTCCPVGAIGGGEACSISAHHWRNRKTGPPLALLVARCRIHGCAFTLYPPGFAPYRRQALLRVSPQGEPIVGVGRSTFGALSSTLFEAASDASRGQQWARSSDTGRPVRWWGTQGRHLELAAAFLGVAQDLSAKVRESIAAVLSVPTLVLHERSRTRGYRARRVQKLDRASTPASV